jgi:hypothetical protein
MEKVEKPYRTATARNILLAHVDKRDHTCAMRRPNIVAFSRAVSASRSVTASPNRAARERAIEAAGYGEIVVARARCGEPDRAVAVRSCQPFAGTRTLPDMSHFAAEF